MAPLKRNRGKKKRQTTDEDAELKEEKKIILEDIARVFSIIPRDAASTEGPPAAGLSAVAVVGVNAVTRALRRPANLRLLIMCQDCQPRTVCEHLAAMAAAARVPYIPLRGSDGMSSLDLGRTVGLRTALAIGIKDGTKGAPVQNGSSAGGSDSGILLDELIERLMPYCIQPPSSA